MNERSANEVDRRIAQLVRRRRLEIGMSQERLAELTGVTFQQIQKYEKGVNRIAASRLLDISNALDSHVSSFFGADANSAAKLDPDRDKILAEPDTIKLLLYFSSIKQASVRRRVVELVRALKADSDDLGKKK